MTALAVLESRQHAPQNPLIYELYDQRAMHEQAEIDNRQAHRFKDALIVETI